MLINSFDNTLASRTALSRNDPTRLGDAISTIVTEISSVSLVPRQGWDPLRLQGRAYFQYEALLTSGTSLNDHIFNVAQERYRDELITENAYFRKLVLPTPENARINPTGIITHNDNALHSKGCRFEPQCLRVYADHAAYVGLKA